MVEDEHLARRAAREESALLRLVKLQNPSQAKLELAESLLKFRDATRHRVLGFDRFQDYCTGRLGIMPSTLRYYLQIARFMKGAGDSVSREEWVALGPTRIRILAQAKVSKRSLPKLVRKYAEIPSRQMAEEFPRR
jgi:hypothetical protein